MESTKKFEVEIVPNGFIIRKDSSFGSYGLSPILGVALDPAGVGAIIAAQFVGSRGLVPDTPDGVVRVEEAGN